MTVRQMAEEISFIEHENEVIHNLMKNETNKETKAEYRAVLSENNHQLLHLRSTLACIKYDPLF